MASSSKERAKVPFGDACILALLVEALNFQHFQHSMKKLSSVLRAKLSDQAKSCTPCLSGSMVTLNIQKVQDCPPVFTLK